MLEVLLRQRGLVTAEQITDFLDPRLAALPDPFSMSGMQAAVDRLCEALAGDQGIAVHGDYDVDGITGTALLVEVLRSLGAQVSCHVPRRLVDGYGLSERALHECAAAGSRVLVSVDCGVSAHAEARLAGELGLDLIITDHHQPPPVLPPALAVLNPQQAGCGFPEKGLAGVGVAFFLAAGLRAELRRRGWFAQRPEPDLRQVLDLVALGTVADLVPLQGVNRILVRAGLDCLQAAGRPGVAALLEVARVREVNSGTVGFRIAPRLNAAGRLEDAALAVELLLCGDAGRCRQLARQLDACNSERQAIEDQTLAQALERVAAEAAGRQAYSLVLADQRWHPGVIGIVASRLVERFHRPAVLIALGEASGKGSARSIRGFHLHRGLFACSDLLDAYGGHEFAAGLSLRPERVADFRMAFEREARRQLQDDDLVPVSWFDLEAELEEVDRDLVDALARLAPFGIGNPEPVLLLRHVRAQQIAPVGDQHLRLICRQGGVSLPAIAFGMASRREELAGELDLLAVPGINRWRGREELQLQVRDIRPAAQAE